MAKGKDILKKVILWRIISIILTLTTIWMVEGDLKEATFITVLLYVILIISHWIFETIWDSKYK